MEHSTDDHGRNTKSLFNSCSTLVHKHAWKSERHVLGTIKAHFGHNLGTIYTHFRHNLCMLKAQFTDLRTAKIMFSGTQFPTGFGREGE